MSFFDLFKKESSRYLVKNTESVFDRIVVWNLIDFFKGALKHYEFEHNKAKSWGVNSYSDEIKIIKNLLDSIEFFPDQYEYFATLSLTQQNTFLEQEEVMWQYIIKCEDLVKIVQFEVMEQSQLQEIYQADKNLVLLKNACDKIDTFKNSWKFLENYRLAFPENFPKSSVLLKISNK